MSVSLRLHHRFSFPGVRALTLASILAAVTALPVAAQTSDPARRKAPDSARPSSGEGEFRFGPVRVAPQGRLEADWRETVSAAGASESTSGLSSTRLGIKGRIGRALTFELSGDPTDRTPWRDVKLAYTLPGSLVLTGGQFKVPFGLDAHRSSFERPLVYQSRLADAYGLGRDLGASLEWRAWHKRLEIEGGAFAHGGVPAVEDRPVRGLRAGTTTLRVALSPFGRSAGPLRSLTIAGGATHSGIGESLSTLTLQTIGNHDLTRPTYWANGTRRRLGLDLAVQPGPLALAAEYAHIEETRRGQGNANEDLAPLQGAGWSIEGALLLTGESARKFKGPRRSIVDGGLGAISVVGRMEQAHLGTPGVSWPNAASPRATMPALSQIRTLTAGLNWYPVGRSRLQFNLIRESLTGATTAEAAAPRQTTAVVRFQIEL